MEELRIALRPRSASLLVLLLIPIILSIIALSSDHFDSRDLPIRINVENLVNDREFRMNEGVFDNRPVMRLQGFEFFMMILERIVSKEFSIFFIMIIYSVSIFLVYLMSLKLTQSPTAAWFSVLLSGSSPIFLSNALSYNEVLISLPIILFSVYLMTQQKISMSTLTFSFIILVLLNFSGTYLIMIILTYLLILSTIGLKINEEIRESVIIMIAIMIGIFTIYSIIFQDYSKFPVFYNNLPTGLLIENLSPLSMLSRLFAPGLIVILFAALGSYYLISKANERGILPFSVLTVGVILSLISSEKLFLAIFAMGASIVGSYGISKFLQWISISKIGSYKKTFFLLLGLFIVFLGITQTVFMFSEIRDGFPSEDEIGAYEYIKGLEENKIFTRIAMAEKAEYYTGKDVFINRDFTGIQDSNSYHNDYLNIVNALSSIQALSLMEDNNIDILIFNEGNMPFFLSEEVIEIRCFEETIFNNVRVYRVICEVER